MAFTSPGNPPITSGDRTASVHKSWLEEFVAAFELVQWFLSQELAGGATGIWAYGSVGYDSCVPSVTGLDMVVTVAAGAGFYGGVPWRKDISSNVAVVAPVSNPRIDLVAWDAENSTLVLVNGTEAASPSAPALPTNHVEICQVYNRVGETVIKSTDDSTNGYITNTRTFVN